MMKKNKYWFVPAAWIGDTVACIGGGPSLTQEQVELCKDKVRAIVINDAYRLAPWADILYACDLQWWRWHKGVPEFAGKKVTIDARAFDLFPDLKLLKNAGDSGLATVRNSIKTGRNSGYQAINLAVHLGVKRILLLGYDMRPSNSGKTHWFGDHPQPTKPQIYQEKMLPHFRTLVSPLKDRGVEVINCTPGSALEDFPHERLENVL